VATWDSICICMPLKGAPLYPMKSASQSLGICCEYIVVVETSYNQI
jgi:hypothetical protein